MTGTTRKTSTSKDAAASRAAAVSKAAAHAKAAALARAAALAAFGSAAIAAGPAQAGELALRRAILSSGGVGYFEYEASVAAGQTRLSLRARLDQVDDILKSLIVMDSAGAASASLPGKAGAEQTFQSLPFGESDLASLPALMSALKGARVSVEAPRKLSGVILAATPETVKDKDGAERTMTRVSLLSGVSVEQFTLEDAQGLAFADARLGAQVEAALAALSAARDKSGRDVAIHLAQGEARTVRLGYVAEAPVWKAAYRLSLGEKGKARLQGWAVLENMTGADWDGVALTLTSGSPVTFRQALYEPYYVARPSVPPPVPKLALPRLDEGQTPLMAQEMERRAEGAKRRAVADVAARAAPAPAGRAGMMAAAAPPPLAVAPAPLGASAAGAAESADGALGASFALTAPVKAKAGESLSLPFLDVETQAGDSDWIQAGTFGPGVGRRQPWRAVRLANATTTPWPAGSVTLYEASAAGPVFVGEAQAPTLPPGQDRLMAFGVDAKVSVDRETTDKGILSEIAFARGVLTVTRLSRETTIYRAKNDDSRPHDLVLDHPRAQGATLVSPKPEEATLAGQDWRLRRSLPPGQTTTIEVTVESPRGQVVSIEDASRLSLARALLPGVAFETMDRSAFAAALAQTKLPAAAVERLQKIADAAEAVAAEQSRIEALEQERGAIFADQERLRANLSSVGQQSDFGRSLVAKLQSQETRLNVIDGETTKAQAAQAAARKTLEDLVGRAGAAARFTSGQTF